LQVGGAETEKDEYAQRGDAANLQGGLDGHCPSFLPSFRGEDDRAAILRIGTGLPRWRCRGDLPFPCVDTASNRLVSLVRRGRVRQL
jgi:hypothetical protein